VLEGEAIIRFRRLFSDGVKTFKVNGEKPSYIDIPTYTTHNITNVGDSNLLTLFWSNVFFDPDNPDTYFEEV
jgi:UDP-2-acetamido-2,6-beta-L-arabino-hexul-4-ose reductase